MKKLLLILLYLPMIGFGQLTMIPDLNFEQKLIDLGYDSGVIDGYVNTDSISSITYLNIYNSAISDLTGIEDFTAITNLSCEANQLTSLDLSNNTALTHLYCGSNQLTNIDFSNNLFLELISVSNNNLASIDITNLDSLENLFASNNQISSIDLSSQTFFVHLFLEGNNLTQLDLTNLVGNAWNCGVAEGNFQCQDLYCIEVNDTACWNNDWLWGIDTTFQQYSSNCNNISNLPENVLRKNILKTTDLLGKETNNQNYPLIYYYSDGTFEKKFIIE